jgi:hypothetical protein
MFRIRELGLARPSSFRVHPSAEFQAGAIGQLTLVGNSVVCGVSNGVSPIGVIDDYKTNAFTKISWQEEIVTVPKYIINVGSDIVSADDIPVNLKNPSIIRNSFTSSVTGVLNEINGVFTFPANTKLNYDLNGSGTPNAIRAIVSYTYRVPGVPGDDTTMGSDRVTVWTTPGMIFTTDQIETNVSYALNASLYVNENGLLTSRKLNPENPAVAMVTAPPVSLTPSIEVIWW